MLALILAAAVSTSSIPSLDISTGCKPQGSVEGQITDYKSCMQDEEATKQKLTKEWASYPIAARRECVSDRPSLVNSYVELLTCIEMETWKSEPAVTNPSGEAAGAAMGARPAGALGGSPPTPGQIGGASIAHPLGGNPAIHIH
ncbi:MAG TPA: hypothetical protein VKU03_10440 [Roseiarcus sp.]|jgi:hypothetical protein|nr:hypothetical protein [Roseiarcus sp.]